MLSVGPDDLRPVTVVINKADPEETVVQFQYIAKRTHDPRERYEAALKYLAGAYYQTPRSFHDCLAAVFGPDEEFPSKLIQYPDCALLFEQYGQR